MLTSIFLVFGIATSAVAALDLLLSNAQKQAIADATVRLWNWLDDAKRLQFLSWLKQRKFQIWYAVVVSVLVSCGASIYVWIVASPDPDRGYGDVGSWIVTLAIFATLVFAFGLLGIFAFVKTMQAETARGVLLRATGYSLASGTPAMAVFLWVVNMDVSGHPDWSFLFAVILLLVTGAITFIIVTIIVMPLAFVYLLSAGLMVFEFVVRRIAEFPKGPILAVGIILTAIGGLGKVFGY